MEQREISYEMIKEIKKAETMDDVVQAFADARIEVTKQQLIDFAESFDGNEFDENDMDAVSGGCRSYATSAYKLGLIVGYYIAKLLKKS